MPDLPQFLRCDGHGNSLIFDLRRGFAELAWIGCAFPDGEDLSDLCNARLRGPHASQPDQPAPASILPQTGWGYSGLPAVQLLKGDGAIEARLPLTDAKRTECGVRFTHSDARCGASVETHWWFAPSGLIQTEARLTNIGADRLELAWLASLAMPLPAWASHAVKYSGRWAAEMQRERIEIRQGIQGKLSYGGRVGFGGGNWVRIEAHDSGELHGNAIAAHLAWSGDHVLSLERNSDGETMLQMGARLEPGEAVLAPGESWLSPRTMVAVSHAGISPTRQMFHSHVAAEIVPPQSLSAPRKVHLNTWEALGFELDMPGLLRLADAAGALGIERFVLDDGWFKGRRNDRTSLGDWTPDPDIFPNGLTPLIDHVQQCGMDFGLWVEPEMVSPDSDLYRAHPDWCLNRPDEDRPTQRHQLVLDLARPEVAEHLFVRLDGLLRDHEIAYLKWDHNRELFPLAGKGHAQVKALYALLDRLRAAHPDVEIETCASGGGRVDLEILRRCGRFWASDNNDALERLAINAGWFDFLPLSIVGNHVGPSPNPITGRQLSMDFRAKVAMFGHMGVEADPASMSDEDRRCLAAHIALYKQWRDVLHTGGLTTLNCPDPGFRGWFAWDGARGLALAAQTAHASGFNVPPVRLSGLEPDAVHRVRLLEPWPRLAKRQLAMSERWRDGLTLSGRALAEAGLALPLSLPEMAWLISVERVR